MNRTLRALAIASLIVGASTSISAASERLVDGILGGAAGGVVLGPVGMVGGALIGATAGPGIARSWGMKRTRVVYRDRRPYRRY